VARVLLRLRVLDLVVLLRRRLLGVLLLLRKLMLLLVVLLLEHTLVLSGIGGPGHLALALALGLLLLLLLLLLRRRPLLWSLRLHLRHHLRKLPHLRSHVVALHRHVHVAWVLLPRGRKGGPSVPKICVASVRLQATIAAVTATATAATTTTTTTTTVSHVLIAPADIPACPPAIMACGFMAPDT
jgi:hypothetical protein